ANGVAEAVESRSQLANPLVIRSPRSSDPNLAADANDIAAVDRARRFDEVERKEVFKCFGDRRCLRATRFSARPADDGDFVEDDRSILDEDGIGGFWQVR